MNGPPSLWYVTRFLPYGWKVSLLKALAWPEYRVDRKVVVSDPTSPCGVSVEHQPITK